jgi:carbon storage regulator
VDESILIGDSIVVTVLAVEGDRIKLGISAPEDVPILRKEVKQAVEEQSRLQALLSDQPEPESFQELRKLLEDDLTDKPSPE